MKQEIKSLRCIIFCLGFVFLSFLYPSCGSRQSSQKQTYVDRSVSTYVQNNSGISQKIELHRDTHTYITYDRFDVLGNNEWSVSCKGSYSEELMDEYGVIEIFFKGGSHLGDYTYGKIFAVTDELQAHSPSGGIFTGYYLKE